MTDRDDMQADIERAMAHSRPKAAAPADPKPGDTVVIPATVMFSHVFEPMRPHPEKPTKHYYTVSFPSLELPKNLAEYAKVVDHKGERLIAVRSEIAPVIVPTATSLCSLDTTLWCGAVSNISGDRMLRGTRVDLLVKLVEFESYNPFVRSRPGGKRLVKTLDFCGIRLNPDAMVNNYDAILRQIEAGMDMWREEE